MTTLDGKITSGKGVDILDEYFELYTKIESKLQTKNWIIGRVTMQAFADDLSIKLEKPNKKIEKHDYILSSENEHNNFVIDTKGKLRWKANTIKFSNVDKKLTLVIIVTQDSPIEYLNYLQKKKISYIFGGINKIDFTKLFKKIQKEFGIQRILLEGGGILNGSIMQENLIDEISLLLLPIVVNRVDAPSIFEGDVQRLLNIKKYSLQQVERIEDDVVWLKYNKTNK